MFSNAAKNAALLLLYNATAWADIAENDSSSPNTQIAVTLHSADPGAAGTMSTNEISYTGMARVNVNRNAGGWTVTGGQVVPAANIEFGQRTDNGAAVVATHFSTGKTGGGATAIHNRGVIGSILGNFGAETTDTFTVRGHGLANGDRVCFYPVQGDTLPTGITEGTVYFVTNATTDTFTVSATSGGATIDITAAGNGTAYKVSPITINQNSIPRLTTATAITID